VSSPRPAALGACFALLLGALVALVASPARAASSSTARPLDAPRAEGVLRVPAPPAEYLVEDGGWVRFVYHPAARERVRTLSSRADALREELVAELGPGVLDLSAPVEVRVAALPTELGRLLPPEVRAPVDVITLWERRIVVMSLASTLGGEPADPEVSFRHALAHLAFDDALGGKPAPRWLLEGFAVSFGGEGSFARGRTLALAAARGRLVPIAALATAMPVDPGLAAGSLEEAEAADFARFAGPGRLRATVARVRAGEAFDRALEAAFGADLVQIGRAWREDAVRRYAVAPSIVALGALFGIAAALLAARRRRLAAAPPSRRGGPRSRGEVVEIRLRSARPRRLDEDDDDRYQGPLPPEPGVPKVEHEGEWHTLH
jgi:hypothetical protein